MIGVKFKQSGFHGFLGPLESKILSEPLVCKPMPHISSRYYKYQCESGSYSPSIKCTLFQQPYSQYCPYKVLRPILQQNFHIKHSLYSTTITQTANFIQEFFLYHLRKGKTGQVVEIMKMYEKKWKIYVGENFYNAQLLNAQIPNVETVAMRYQF